MGSKSDKQMTPEEAHLAAIRKSIKRRYAARTEFFSHLIPFVIINGLIWLSWMMTPSWLRMSIGPLLIFSGLWLSGLLVHMVQMLGKEAEEKAFMDEVNAERETRTRYDKPYNAQLYRLTDEGELESEGEDEAYWESQEKAKRR